MSAVAAIAGSALAIACMLALRLHVQERLLRQRMRAGHEGCAHNGCGGGCSDYPDRRAATPAPKPNEQE